MNAEENRKKTDRIVRDLLEELQRLRECNKLAEEKLKAVQDILKRRERHKE